MNGDKMIDCPRCLGKGNVDFNDIKRLRREFFWTIGPYCAFCNGNKQVNFSFASKFNADDWFITSDLLDDQYQKYINGDEELINEIKKQEELIYFVGNFIMNYHFGLGLDKETVLKLLSDQINIEIDGIEEFVYAMFEQIKVNTRGN
jgi:hypothetical protein